MALDAGELWVKTGHIFTLIEQTYSLLEETAVY